jgi:hypothetical protein
MSADYAAASLRPRGDEGPPRARGCQAGASARTSGTSALPSPHSSGASGDGPSPDPETAIATNPRTSLADGPRSHPEIAGRRVPDTRFSAES